MPLCASGSSPNPTAPPYAWVTWVDAQAWLGALSSKFSWLSYLIQPLLVETASFCLVEPTQPVYPGDATVVAASHDPAAFETLLQYLRDSAVWYVWSRVCQCNASGVPGCLGQAMDHSAVHGATVSQAYARGIQFVVSTSGLTLWGIDFQGVAGEHFTGWWESFSDSTNHFEPFVVPATGWNRYMFTSPKSITIGQLYKTGVRPNPCGGNMSYSYQLSGNDNALPADYVTFADQSYPCDLSINNPDAGFWMIDPIVCVGSPGAIAPTPPPAPVTVLPDIPTVTCASVGDLCGIMQPTIDQTALLKQRLDLLQRRLLPFAWIPGAPHVGLAGTGVLAVTDCLGCIVTITTWPLAWGRTAETPARSIPAMGSIQATHGISVDDNRQVHYQNEIFIWQAPFADGIRYNLRGGIVATVTPIFPEP